jgi:uncharacterized protein YegP (UPF0339 family)
MAARYEKYTGTNGQYYFRLIAGNNEKILRSEGYVSAQGRDNGIASVRTNSHLDSRYARNRSSNGQYYFNLKGGNGEIIGTSEMYTSSSGMETGITSVKVNGPTAPVVG